MLNIRIENNEGTYRYYVFVNGKEIERGDYSGHNRGDGWAALVLDITLRHLTPRAVDWLYCPHCGEPLSDHLITERGWYCSPAIR